MYKRFRISLRLKPFLQCIFLFILSLCISYRLGGCVTINGTAVIVMPGYVEKKENGRCKFSLYLIIHNKLIIDIMLLIKLYNLL